MLSVQQFIPSLSNKLHIFFCFPGTGTNVCYMEEVKNIEKSKGNIGKMEREETTPGSEEDRVREMVLSISCDLNFLFVFVFIPVIFVSTAGRGD